MIYATYCLFLSTSHFNPTKPDALVFYIQTLKIVFIFYLFLVVLTLVLF